MKKIVSVVLVLALILLGGCSPKKESYTVKFYDGETIRFIGEVDMKHGAELTVPEEFLEDGRSVQGLYMTSTLSARYPEGTKVTGDMVVFIQWQGEAGEPEDDTLPTEPEDGTQPPADGEPVYMIGEIPMVMDGETGLYHAEVALTAGAEVTVTDITTGGSWLLGTADSDGSYMALIGFEAEAPTVALEKIAYYIVGTCGNGGWAADAVATNTKYRMVPEGDVYVLDVDFGDGDIGVDGKVSFKVARGAAGVVTHWYGDENGDSLSVDIGKHTITFDAVAAEVLFG